MPTMKRITGFEFKIQEADSMRWVRLQASGGVYGGERLDRFKKTCLDTDLANYIDRLHHRVVDELHMEGSLREWVGDDLPYTERIKKINPDNILEVKPIWDTWQSPLSATQLELCV